MLEFARCRCYSSDSTGSGLSSDDKKAEVEDLGKLLSDKKKSRKRFWKGARSQRAKLRG